MPGALEHTEEGTGAQGMAPAAAGPAEGPSAGVWEHSPPGRPRPVSPAGHGPPLLSSRAGLSSAMILAPRPSAPVPGVTSGFSGSLASWSRGQEEGRGDPSVTEAVTFHGWSRQMPGVEQTDVKTDGHPFRPFEHPTFVTRLS